MDGDFTVEEEERPTRCNLVLNLLDREIGSNTRKYGTQLETYRHSHQLVVGPETEVCVAFEVKSDPEERDIDFDANSKILGFSPDGKYLAFESHSATMLTVFEYSGINAKRDDCDMINKIPQGPIPHHRFFAKHHTKLFTRLIENAAPHEIYDSWWTDDSTTIIFKMAITAYFDDFDLENDADQDDDMMEISEDLDIGDVANSEEDSEPISDEDEDYIDENGLEPGEIPRDVHPCVIPEIERRIAAETDEHEEARAGWIREYNHNYPENAIPPPVDSDPEEEEMFVNPRGKPLQSVETSRTLPYWIAAKTASSISIDAARSCGETSRTMPVYNALTRSLLVPEGEGSEEETVATEEPTQHVPYIPSAELQEWIRNHQGEIPPDNGTNSNHIGFCSATSYARSRQHKGYSRIFRLALRSDYTPDIPEREPIDTDIDLASFAVVAYDIERDLVDVVYFKHIFKQCDIQMRNRRLLLLKNHGYIGIYDLNKADNRWRRMRCSNLDWTFQTTSFRMDFSPDTVAGTPARRIEPQTAKVFDFLYSSEEFNTPLQQLTKSILLIHLPRLHKHFETFARHCPTIKYVRLIKHDALVIIQQFQDIEVGMVVELTHHRVTLFPDYAQFLQFLFIHHFADLLPRQWTYLCPHPVTENPCFRQVFLDIANRDEMTDIAFLRHTFDDISKIWNSPLIATNAFNRSIFFFNGSERHLYDFQQIRQWGIGNTSIMTTFAREIYRTGYLIHPTDQVSIYRGLVTWVLRLPRDGHDRPVDD